MPKIQISRNVSLYAFKSSQLLQLSKHRKELIKKQPYEQSGVLKSHAVSLGP